MSRKPYNPTHGFQNLCSFAQWLWVFRPGQGYPCLTGGPKMISYKLGTCIFKTVVAPQKALFDERPEWIQIATNCAMLNIARLYHFKPPLVTPT